MPDNILVFIPCYNCANQIGRVLEKVYARMKNSVHAVVIVDNCSMDQTVKVATDLVKTRATIPTTILQNEKNYGLGGSHKVAFNYALWRGFTHIIVLHGDDQANIGNFSDCLKTGLYRNYDAILGSRFMPGSHLYGYGRFRRLGNLVFNLLFTLASRRSIKDLGSGLNLYSRKILEDGDHLKAADDLTFHCYLLLTMAARRRNLKFVPIDWYEEDQASNAKLFRQAWNLLGLTIIYSLKKTVFLSKNYSNPQFDYVARTVFERAVT